MSFFIAVVISGISLGLLYGAIGFSVIALYKTTGIVSFAQPNLAMFATFVLYFIQRRGIPGLSSGSGVWLIVPIGSLLGVAVYLLIMRPNDRFGRYNLILRTLALYGLLFEIANTFWSTGQPYTLRTPIPTGSFKIGLGVVIPWVDVVVVAVLAGLIALLLLLGRSDIGLMLRAVADDPEVVRLMGGKARRLTAIAWATSTTVCAVVGVLVAQVSLLSTNFMTPYLLLGLAGAILGGITSWAGGFVGGLLIGVANNITVAYGSTELATLVTFGILFAVLLIAPRGLLGSHVVERL